MRKTTPRGSPFFQLMALILIAMVLTGFVPLAATREGGPMALPFLLHVHGAVFLCWYILFFVQARLAGTGSLGLHRTLGGTSVVIAAAMVVLANLVIRLAYSRPDFSIAGLGPTASVMFPFTDILNFAVVYSLALVNRKNADAHKRLMLLAGILMIDPAAARIALFLDAPQPVILLLELALFLALFGYDIVTRRRPHWASLLGFALYVGALAAKFTLAGSAAWAAFAGAAFGQQ